MCDVRDPAIKLFGKTIPVAGDGDDDDFDGSTFSDQLDIDKDGAEQESMEMEQPDDASPPAKEASGDPPATAQSDENQSGPGSDNDSEKDTESPKGENDSSNESKNSPQKPLKKPDKILPCPRCNSMDTKFCYYNNYNVNQPRHFCKSCQRYWTAGGTMRNVPVGAGRRKNKSSVSRYCHITVSEALQAAQIVDPNGVLHPGLKPNGTVLTFGPDNPLCESMASVLNLADKKIKNLNVQKSRENDDHSTASTVTSSSMDDGVKKGQDEAVKPHLNGFTTQMPCFQWPYMWNPTVPVPPFCPSSFPMPIYPAPYWNGAIPWNFPWVPPYSPGSQGLKSPGSNPSSPTLGKHSRDGETLTPNNTEKGPKTTTVLVPKTLRIDDPADAAKSSIWTTLGIKKEKGDHISRGFFNNFQTKAEEKDKKIEAPPALKANPAALCRSISFQESAKR